MIRFPHYNVHIFPMISDDAGPRCYPRRHPLSFPLSGSYSLASRLISGWIKGGVNDGPEHSSLPATLGTWAGDQVPQVTPVQGLMPIRNFFEVAPSIAINLPTSNLRRSFLQVSLDEGVFKYVLMRLSDPETGRNKLLVWGEKRAGEGNRQLGGKVTSLPPTSKLQPPTYCLVPPQGTTWMFSRLLSPVPPVLA